jgi:hypothetical protein
MRRGFSAAGLAATLALAGLAAGLPAAARAFDCHAALVLALDASDSVDPAEAELQRRGIAAALRDPAVRAAISPAPGAGIMLHVFEWSDPGLYFTLAEWTRLDGSDGAEALAAEIEALPPTYLHGQTGIGAAMERAVRQLDVAGVPCARRIVDVSGDGPGNIGPSPEKFRKSGLFDGVTINGLVIRHPSFDSAHPPGRDPLPYYQLFVRQGAGSFIHTVGGYEDYARAIRDKLLRELSPTFASRD